MLVSQVAMVSSAAPASPAQYQKNLERTVVFLYVTYAALVASHAAHVLVVRPLLPWLWELASDRDMASRYSNLHLKGDFTYFHFIWNLYFVLPLCKVIIVEVWGTKAMHIVVNIVSLRFYRYEWDKLSGSVCFLYLKQLRYLYILWITIVWCSKDRVLYSLFSCRVPSVRTSHIPVFVCGALGVRCIVS